jgi:hypothetical protein
MMGESEAPSQPDGVVVGTKEEATSLARPEIEYRLPVEAALDVEGPDGSPT